MILEKKNQPPMAKIGSHGEER